MARHDDEQIPINSISDLRKHAIQTLDKLVAGNIEVSDALAASRLYNNVVDMLKVETDYNKALGKHRQVEFLEPAPTEAIKLPEPQRKVLSQTALEALEGKSTRRGI